MPGDSLLVKQSHGTVYSQFQLSYCFCAKIIQAPGVKPESKGWVSSILLAYDDRSHVELILHMGTSLVE